MSNALITVQYEGNVSTFELSGTELSVTVQDSGRVHKYLNTASRGFIDDQIEKALIEVTKGVRYCRDCGQEIESMGREIGWVSVLSGDDGGTYDICGGREMDQPHRPAEKEA